jgi:HEAT repeat protein
VIPLARAGRDDALRTLLAILRARVVTHEQRREALDVLAARVAEKPSAIVLNALGALACEEPRAMAALVEGTRHADAFVRFDAAIALGHTGSPDALEALEALANDKTMPRDEDRSTAWSVGESAKKAIAKIRAKP